MTPPPSTGHNARGADLLFVLRQAAPPGWRVVYEVGIHAPNRNFVADIVVLRPGAPTDGSWREASQVALAVEIESPSTRLYDRLLKSRLYAEAGIPSYWRLDPKGPVLYAYELTDKGEYTEVAQVRPGSPWRAEQPFAIVVDPAAWGP